tara:strand:+ start:839 stop:1273 length:435 start_codon:yes stop_codon:yes gene_type:complete
MNFYLILKSLHLIAVISWMAGLLYLPRIFVYHSENISNNDICSVFKVMERRLYFYIMYPAMLLSWIFGLTIIHVQGAELLQAKWFIIKIVAALILTGYHFYLGHCFRSFNQNINNNSPRYYRIINEIPTVLLILIVFLAILKPI